MPTNPTIQPLQCAAIESTIGSAVGKTLPQPSKSIPTSSVSNGDGAKRRSFLPQPGEFRLAPRRADAGPTLSEHEGDNKGTTLEKSIPETKSSVTRTPLGEGDVQGARQGRLRPRSMYQTSSTRTTQRSEVDGGAKTRTMRPLGTVDKGSMPRSMDLSRSQSLRKASASTASSQLPTARSHVRTQSTSTVTTTGKSTAGQQERPKSLLVPSIGSVKPSIRGSATVADVTGGQKSSTRLMALKRSASVKSKPEATDDSTVPPIRIETDHQALSTSSRHREPPKEDVRKQPRPAFSTLQQHFTPRKAGKAPTSTFLHPVAPEVGPDSIPSELASLQSELLQLHLLHVSSAETVGQWELSAKRSLHCKFDEVKGLYQVMREIERRGQEQQNVRALRDWNSGNSSFGLSEHIHILSGPLHELPSLVDPDGRFRRLVGEFQRWTTWVEEVWTARNGCIVPRSGDLVSVEGLGDSWKEEVAALTRKLTSLARDLDKLTQPTPGSSVACIVGTCKELLCGILDELRVMQTIEAGIVAREREWVEAQLKAIARDIGGHLDTHEVDATWRRL